MRNGRTNLKRTITYVRHYDNKLDYVEGIAQRKHIVVDKIRYISKESNNLDGLNGIDMILTLNIITEKNSMIG